MTDDVSLTIDGHELSVPKGTLVIRAAERLGITIPRFCEHPLLDPIGACRQCMVEVEGQRKPFTACTTTCTEGMVVKTHMTSDVARIAQEGQLEFLLINHPLDCPMCDKGGECPLQDQTLAHGPPDSRMIDKKRRYLKPIAISPQIGLDRERCVLCARCTRFSSQISGDPFIELFERAALEQVAIYEGEPYNSYFSGNVVQICPVGALTSTSYRFKSRPFDLRSADGVCNHCSAGCNLRVDLRRGEIQRQLARENMDVNETWNCDKGRFAYAFVAHPDRLATPRARNEFGAVDPTGWRQALKIASDRLTGIISEHGPDAVGVIAGGKLTDEDAYAVGRFTRDVIGTDNVDFRRSPRDEEEREVFAAIAGTQGPTYSDVEKADLVIIAGLDPEEEVPILYLRLRKAWRDNRQRIVGVGPALGSLKDIAWRWIRTPVGGEGQVLAALHEEADAPRAGGDLDALREAMRDAESVVVIAGERLARSTGGLRAAARLANGTTRFSWVSRQTNARGAVDAGLVPGMLPGGRGLADPGPVTESWNRVPSTAGMNTREMLQAAKDGAIKALVLVGADPATDAEDPTLAEQALRSVDTVISLDLLPTASNRYADVLLPACAPQERVGSYTTWEGRRQPFGQTVPPQGMCLEDWDILRQLARTMGVDLGWETAMDVRREAAPLMVGTAPPSALGEIEWTTVEAPQDQVSAGMPEEGSELDAVIVDLLLGNGTMLLGAHELRATAKTPTAVISREDATRMGLSDGQHVDVGASDGAVRLPVQVSDGVAQGCVVLPGGATPLVRQALAGMDVGGPVRVKIAAVEPVTA